MQQTEHPDSPQHQGETEVPNPVVHFEILGPDAKKLQDFYSSLFGWTIDANNEMQYGTVDNGGQGINGGVAPSDDGGPRSIFYISVKDATEHLQKIESMGGKTVTPATVIPGMVTYALFTDPAGNLIGLVNEEMPPA
jgi:uncharacterized protein